MNILKMACIGVALLGHTVIAHADPKLVPHRGMWKHYSNQSVPENSVAGYHRAAKKKVNGNYKADFVEMDVRRIWVDGVARVVIFHDKVFDRMTDYNDQGYGDWAKKNFTLTAPLSTTSINSAQLTWGEFDKIRLKRMTKDGSSKLTKERLLELKDFVEQTACKKDLKLLLDVQDREVADLASDVVAYYTCPTGTKHAGDSFAKHVYLKLFVGRTFPTDVQTPGSVTGDASALSAQLTTWYGAGIKYYLQFNSSQFSSDCETGEWCPITTGGSDNRKFASKTFLQGALSDPAVAGIALSMPAEYPGEGDNYPVWRETINNMLDYLVEQDTEKKLMSIASRPEGAIMFKAKKQTGKGSKKNKKIKRCYPFIYEGGGGNLLFYSRDAFNVRNEFAMQDEFDYVVADGYIDKQGNIGFNTNADMGRLCSLYTYIVLDYQSLSGDSETTKAARYRKMNNEYKDYFWIRDKKAMDFELGYQ